MDPKSIPFPGEADSNPDMRSYWDACNAGQLLLTRCRDTGRVFAYPRSISPFTLSDNVEWFEATGAGRVYAFSTTRSVSPPYTIAYVQLEEGVSILTGIVDCEEDQLEIGMRVKLSFRETSTGQKAPFFAPA